LVGGGFLLRDGGSSFVELLLQDIVPDEFMTRVRILD